MKGNHSKGSGSKGTDLCKKCDWPGHCARDCRGPREGAEKGTKGDDGKRTGKGKDTVKKFDGNCRNCGKYDHRTETCWTTCSTKLTEKGQGKCKKDKQVNVLDEQEESRCGRREAHRRTVKRFVSGKLQSDA